MPADQPRKVFLHVGSPKTGTTFLQNVLWGSRALAAAQGLHQPGKRFFDHFLASLDVRGLAAEPTSPARAAGMWQRFVDEVRHGQGDWLISHELFAGATADQARAAVEAFGPGLEVHLVVTARDLMRQLPAEWQEHVKHRSQLTLPQFMADVRADAAERRGWFWQVQDVAGIVERWGAALPREHVHVVTVPQSGSGLWDRFALLLGLDPASFDLSAAHSNSSLGQEQAEVLRRLNVALEGRMTERGAYPNHVKEKLAHTVMARRDGARIQLTGDDVTFAEQESEAIIARLEALGVDVVGDLDELRPRVPEHAPGEYPVLGAEVVLDEAIGVLADLIEDVAGRTPNQDWIHAARTTPFRYAVVRTAETNRAMRGALAVWRKARGRD